MFMLSIIRLYYLSGPLHPFLQGRSWVSLIKFSNTRISIHYVCLYYKVMKLHSDLSPQCYGLKTMVHGSILPILVVHSTFRSRAGRCQALPKVGKYTVDVAAFEADMALL